MTKTTGSKLPLAMRCPASMALPWIDTAPNGHALRGSIVHAFLERVATGGIDAALESVPEAARPLLRAIDVAALPVDLLPEPAYALDWKARSARFLGTGIDRQYGALGPTEIALTSDLVGVSEDAVRVIDYKTGRSRYGPADEFAQLLAGALAACWTYGKDRAVVELIYLDEDGEAFPSRGELDGWDLDTFADELERTMIAVQAAESLVAVGGTPDVSPGPHCVDMYCPAYRACPAKSALVRHMPAHVAELQQPGYLAPARLAVTWHRIQEIKRIADAIEEEIRALAIREPIDLGDGRMLGPRERRVESIDARTAHAVLLGLLGQEFADGAIFLETTKAAIERQAAVWRDRQIVAGVKPRPVLSNRAGDGVLDRIYSEIRERGGASVKVTNNPTIYKKPRALP